MSRPETVFVSDFVNDVDVSGFKMPMIVAYNHPIDFPDKFIARLFDLQTPTPYAVAADSLEEIDKLMKRSGRFHKLPRDPRDDPKIVAVYF